MSHTPSSSAGAAADYATAQAFSSSWNNLPTGSVYTHQQFVEWFEPLDESVIKGASVLELGCGNGSLLQHALSWQPRLLVGVDLGDSVSAARASMREADKHEAAGVEELRANPRKHDRANWLVVQADLLDFSAAEHAELADVSFDLVYCIGVLHHLKSPSRGFEAVLRNTKPGGRFHCWVYAREGNGVIRGLVEPMRRVASMLPWWITKYAIATPVVVPYFVYAKVLRALPRWGLLRRLPLYLYSLWIGERGFRFFRHVAFDQLVTPETVYLEKSMVERWLASPEVDPDSAYVIFRNGNSWKFGGRKRSVEAVASRTPKTAQ